MIAQKTRKNPTCHTRRDMCKNSGFTLIEVMIVIAIFSALAAIGYPTLSKWMPNYNLKAAVRGLHADFQRAKLHAVKTNRDVFFSFTDDNTCTGTTNYTFFDTNNTPLDFTDDTVVAGKTMTNGVCITDSSFIVTSGVTSRGLPTAVGAQGTVKLSHEKLLPREYEITQTVAGSIRIK